MQVCSLCYNIIVFSFSIEVYFANLCVLSYGIFYNDSLELCNNHHPFFLTWGNDPGLVWSQSFTFLLTNDIVMDKRNISLASSESNLSFHSKFPFCFFSCDSLSLVKGSTKQRAMKAVFRPDFEGLGLTGKGFFTVDLAIGGCCSS